MKHEAKLSVGRKYLAFLIPERP